jgi:hypothetical protein
MTFASLLASEMERAELSDVMFANQAGLTRAQVHNLRTGRGEPTLATFVRLVRVLPGLAAILYTYTKNGTVTSRPRHGAKETTTRDRRPRKRP